MITCYTLDGIIYKEGRLFEDFNNICSSLETNIDYLNSIPVEALILMLDQYSKKISVDKKLLSIEGVPFLSFFMKKGNIKKLISSSLGDEDYLNRFIENGDGKFLKAQGRGIVCHWIAGNVPTLFFFSAVQAILSRNSNIIRVPKKIINNIIQLLVLLDNIEINYKGETYSSKIILKNICLINFDSNDMSLNQAMSQKADARVIWGGEAAVNTIARLLKKTTCKDLVFGPRYSFAIFDKEIIEGNECHKFMENFIMDITTFEQNACSSPHVLFIEKSKLSIKEVMDILSRAFDKIDKRHPNILNESTAAKVINKRGLYGLSLDKFLLCGKGLKYTILSNNNFCLEEPTGGRCIVIKEINDIFDIKKLITKRIQTIGVAFNDKCKVLKFADNVTSIGVDRVVEVGIMNNYDYPWDGYFMINELVRWCSVNIN